MNSGLLGLVTATALARHGALVVLAVRNTGTSEQAAPHLRRRVHPQLATNLPGHFALTGLLLGNLAAAWDARVASLRLGMLQDARHRGRS
jgi:hypothetical protein